MSSNKATTTDGSNDLSRLFYSYRNKLNAVVGRLVKAHDIEDIVQESFVKAFQASQTQSIEHPKAFLRKTAKNLAINHISRADAMNHLADLSEAEDDEVDAYELAESLEKTLARSLETTVASEEKFLHFCRAVRALPSQCKKVLILKKVYGMSQKEVAEYLGLSVNTVENHLSRGVLSCRRYMIEQGYVECAKQRATTNEHDKVIRS